MEYLWIFQKIWRPTKAPINRSTNMCLLTGDHARRPNSKKNPSGYSLIPCPVAAQAIPGQGLAFLISSRVAYNPLSIRTNLQAQAIQINLGQLITVCNIYISPQQGVTSNPLPFVNWYLNNQLLFICYHIGTREDLVEIRRIYLYYNRITCISRRPHLPAVILLFTKFYLYFLFRTSPLSFYHWLFSPLV